MSLRTRTINSFIWQSIGTIGSGFIGFLITMFLARHLTPADFGVIEIILSFVVISEVLIDSGFTQSIIKENDIDNKALTGVFLLNLSISLLIYIVLFCIAPIIASYFELSHSFVSFFRVLNLKIIIDAFAFCQIANCIRQMKFEIIAQTSLFAIIIAALCSIVCIHFDMGIWALVVYYLAQSFFKTSFIIFKIKWLPSKQFDLSKIIGFIKFGGNIMISQLFDKAVTSIESMSIGKNYTSADLGNFSQSRKLDSMIIQNLLGVVQKVSYPALAKIEAQEQLRLAYSEIMRLAFWVIYPIATFCFFFSETVIVIIFGDNWLSAAPFLKIFSVYSMLMPIQSIGMNIFMVKQRTDLLRNINIVKQIVRLILIFILVKYSIYTFTIGIVSVTIISGLLYLYFGGNLIGYPIWSIFKDNFITLISTLSIGVLVYYISCHIAFESIMMTGLFASVCYFVLYFVVSSISGNEAFKSAQNIISTIVHRRSYSS